VIYLFDWGNTLMVDDPNEQGPMYRRTQIRLCDQAETMLKTLSERYLCCLASNAGDSDRDDIRKALTRGGIDGYISEIFCARSLGCKKPSTEFFRAVCRVLDCLAGDLTVVGDDPVNDYAWARDNGARALLYDPTGRFRGAGFDRIERLMDLCGDSGIL
jgi:FMN phosphatase YigB (HAD superfamily)